MTVFKELGNAVGMEYMIARQAHTSLRSEFACVANAAELYVCSAMRHHCLIRGYGILNALRVKAGQAAGLATDT